LKAAAYLDKADRNKALKPTLKALTIEEALKIVAQYKRKALCEEITFQELYERWLPFYEPRIDKSTMAGHKAAMGHFRDLWSLPFASLSADDLQDCIDSCPKGRRTQENMKSLGKRLYEFAIGRKIATVNCADYVYISKDGNQRRAALKTEHVQMIKEQIGHYPFAEYVYCLCYLGFRPNEMLQLTKEAFHSQDGVDFFIAGFKTAAGTDRLVTIAPPIAPIIKKLMEKPGPYIFPGPEGEMIDDEFLREKVFYPLLEKLNIQKVPTVGERAEYVPYSCRHFFSNLLKDAAGSDKDKAALIGHSDYETTKRIYQSEDLHAMKIITDSFK
jgi:integrase